MRTNQPKEDGEKGAAPNPAHEQPKADKPKPSVISLVQDQLALYESRGLVFPPDYNVQNALASAKLVLLKVQDKDKKNVVDANGRPTGICTEASMVNAILDMCIQAMHVDKKQGYFIVYGAELTFQRSVWGDIALAKRIDPNIEVYSDVVFKDDDFEYEKIRGRTCIMRHKSSLGNQGNDKIIGAYCAVYNLVTGEDFGAVVMSLERIHTSWSKSKTFNNTNIKHDTKTHVEFADEMCLRTVTRRRLKPILNSSDDSFLEQAIKRQEDLALIAEINQEVAEHANSEPLAIPAQAESVVRVPTTMGAPARTPEPERVRAAMLPIEDEEEEGNPY